MIAVWVLQMDIQEEFFSEWNSELHIIFPAIDEPNNNGDLLCSLKNIYWFVIFRAALKKNLFTDTAFNAFNMWWNPNAVKKNGKKYSHVFTSFKKHLCVICGIESVHNPWTETVIF